MRLTLSTTYAILGSFLYGYQTAVIAGAMLFVSGQFNWTAAQEGWGVAILLIAAWAGVLLGGLLSDRLGRKAVLGIEALCMVFGTLTVSLASESIIFLLGRAMTGIGVGLVSMISPLYLTEISAVERRGRIVSLHQLLITMGVVAAYLACWVFQGDWKWMFALGLYHSKKINSQISPRSRT